MATSERIELWENLPTYAYNDLDQARSLLTLESSHRPTWRGLANAIKRADHDHEDYSRNYGNGAAHQIRIRAFGLTASPHYWRFFLDCVGQEWDEARSTFVSRRGPITRADCDRYLAICRQVQAELAARDRREEAEERAESEREQAQSR